MWRHLFIAVLVISIASVRAESEEDEEDIYEYAEDEIEERAFIVAQQKIVETEVSDGTNVTVLLTLFNAGTRFYPPKLLPRAVLDWIFDD